MMTVSTYLAIKYGSVDHHPNTMLLKILLTMMHLALSRVADGDFPIAPNATPTAKPSTEREEETGEQSV